MSRAMVSIQYKTESGQICGQRGFYQMTRSTPLAFERVRFFFSAVIVALNDTKFKSNFETQ